MTTVVSEETEKRLDEWARWARDRSHTRLGYPRRSIEGRLRDDGGVLPTTNHHAAILCHEAAEEIERLIIALSQRAKEPAEVLMTEYLYYEPIAFKAKRLCMTRTTYVNYRDEAKAWIDGCLHRKSLPKLDIDPTPV